MSLPLAHLRIIDVSQVWAGPRTTRMLADMGAEVIKVESITRFDFSRGTIRPAPGQGRYIGGDPGPDPYNRVIGFHQNNRNKLGITLDLQHPQGVELFKRLVRVSDVVIDNFSYGVMDKFGLGYPVLREVNPGIIMMSMPAFGATGPERHYLSYGVTQEPLSGLLALTGYHDDDTPLPTGAHHGDPINGNHAVGAILAALWQRRRTGQGQFIDFSHLESTIALIGDAVMDYTMNQRVVPRIGNRDPFMAPQGCYRCKGEDKWVVISIDDDDAWQRLCQAMGKPDLAADPRFTTVVGRREHHDALDRMITAWTEQYEHYQVMDLLQQHGIAAGAVLDAKEVTENPHMAARGYFKPLHHPDVGSFNHPGIPYKLSRTQGELRRPAPALGEHNREVYQDLLGLSAEEVAALEAEGLIGTIPLPTAAPSE
ncbi:MAG: CoA transferase [Chloroflexi bacterium]|nr:CoA transferase [Chloroflexota bacterium]